MNPTKRVTQQDIARILGISRGTVVRALTGRSDINPETRQMILDKAEELGYVPNRLARSLQRSNSIVISAAVPKVDFFWKQIFRGLEKARDELEEHGARVRFYPLDEKTYLQDHITALERGIEQGINGLVVAPVLPELAKPIIKRAAEAGVPVVTLNVDYAPGLRLFYIGPDDLQAGRLAANVLGMSMPSGGRVAVVSLPESLLSMASRIRGFRESLSQHRPDVELAEVAIIDMPASVDELKVRPVVEKLLDEDGINGLYFTYGGRLGEVAAALRDRELCGKVKIVCHDLSEEISALIQDGTILATIGQGPIAQGYRSVVGLYRYLVDNNDPPTEIQHARLDVIVAENLATHLS